MRRRGARTATAVGATLALGVCAACGSDGETTGTGGAGGSVGAFTNGAGGSFSTVGSGGGNNTGGDDCSGNIKLTIRDFSSSHPDFETFSGSAETTGLVEADLGMDDKPVFATVGNPPQLTGKTEFDQWYRDVSGVNEPFVVFIQLTKMGGKSVFESNAFFPLDGMGFGNEGENHNFHFTTEAHVRFDYQGGEVFTFTGDDDLWLFINKRLALDLGGLHPEVSGTVDLDALAGQLGITVGESYAMDIFHAERHTSQSNFRIETTIDCFVPGPIPD
jgi:fibro-slime domain-containing protein